MTNLEELTQYIKKFSADAVETFLNIVKIFLVSENTVDIHGCLYCSATKVIRYRHKWGKHFPKTVG